MFFLVTGASGVGKSTVRRLVEAEFSEVLEATELGMLGSSPKWSLEWRHRMVEKAVQRAIEACRNGKHFLLCGDPVPPGEVWAAPSADRLDGLEVCLLDADESSQTARLQKRGDEAHYIPHHVSFATWMRGHVFDHRHRPEVIMQNGWPPMRWDRWTASTLTDRPWRSHRVDTTARAPEEVATLVAQWLRERVGTPAGGGPEPF